MYGPLFTSTELRGALVPLQYQVKQCIYRYRYISI